MRISDWSSDVCSSDLRKWAIVSFTVTIPPLAALAAWQIGAGFDAVTVFGATAALSLPFDLVMTLGWAALILWLIAVTASDAARARLAAAGRMAFTNYLMPSIVMTTIFYGYGLGLLDRTSTRLKSSH